MIIPVVVVVNKMKPLIHAIVPVKGTTTDGSSKRFFYVPTTPTVPHTITSTSDCGGVGVKRFSLTQGGRLHEGSTPSDKRPSRLMDCCRDKFSGSINKAVDSIKGQTPMLTPNWVKVWMLLIIIPTVALVCPKGM
jgi:hypothetical protein